MPGPASLTSATALGGTCTASWTYPATLPVPQQFWFWVGGQGTVPSAAGNLLTTSFPVTVAPPFSLEITPVNLSYSFTGNGTGVFASRTDDNLPVTVPAPTVVTVSPSTTMLTTGATSTFSATVTGGGGGGVTWTTDGGTIDSAGMYTAPATAGVFHVRATATDGSGAVGSATVHVMSPGSWTTLAGTGSRMITPQSTLAAAQVGSSIWTFGGLATGVDGTKVVEALDLNTLTWSSAPPMPIPRVGAAAAAWGGKVFLFGGSPSGTLSPVDSQTLVFDPGLNSWTTLANMPTARVGATAVTVGNKIYVIGGYNGVNNWMTTVEIYDPSAGTWSTGPSLKYSRGYLGAAALNGTIYAVAGFGVSPGPQAIEVLAPLATSWTDGTFLSTGRGALGVAAVAGKVYAAGGLANSSYYALVEGYDPLANGVFDAASMAGTRAYFTLVPTTQVIFAIGGESTGTVEIFAP